MGNGLGVMTCTGLTFGKSAGIVHRSVIRWKLFTLPNQIILRRFGRLGTEDETAVRRARRQIFS